MFWKKSAKLKKILDDIEERLDRLEKDRMMSPTLQELDSLIHAQAKEMEGYFEPIHSKDKVIRKLQGRLDKKKII